MKNTTIYLAKVTMSKDYEADLTVELEAFDALEKAEAFMVSCGMISTGFGLWERSRICDYEGSIITLEVK